jgi:hypothetical protein
MLLTVIPERTAGPCGSYGIPDPARVVCSRTDDGRALRSALYPAGVGDGEDP